MHPQTATAASNVSAESTAQDLFALSDEQILEIEPDVADSGAQQQHAVRLEAGATPHVGAAPVGAQHVYPEPRRAAPQLGTASTDKVSSASHQSPATNPDAAEPPPWLAAQMKDPWAGSEAREFWNGVQQARQETAAYRAAFATPEDARALKELYPGGVPQARTAAERARVLDDIDRAYFGAAGSSPEQLSAARAQLAQQMLREDPAAFREMVVAGLRALEEAEKGTSSTSPGITDRTVAAVEGSRQDALTVPRSFDSGAQTPRSEVYSERSRATQDGNHAHLAAYAAFERAANEDLERTVGAEIERTLAQALPVAQPLLAVRGRGEGSQERVTSEAAHGRTALHARLSAAVRADIEKALQGDRQLGEQVAQILASHNSGHGLSTPRFDEQTRAQVVRLIAERAQQLVPGAAKRVLNEWTQTTLAAHRSRSARAESAASRIDLAPATDDATIPRLQAAKTAQPARNDNSRAHPAKVNYGKLSDEQILEM